MRRNLLSILSVSVTLFVSLLFLPQASCYISSSLPSLQKQQHVIQPHHHGKTHLSKIASTTTKSTSTTLFSQDPDSTSTSKPQGVYARPSAAIERGSGFYVPGLEGSRVRILFGILVLALSYINFAIVGLSGGDASNVDAVSFSQRLVTFYGILLLFQGTIEFAKENGLGFDFQQEQEQKKQKQTRTNDDHETVDFGQANKSNKNLNQMVSSTLKDTSSSLADTIRWVAASFVALTPATHVLLLKKNSMNDNDYEILYSLGDFETSNIDNGEAINAAINTIFQSKGGRVAVPDTHPCATLLPENNRRCVLLQQLKKEGDNGNGGQQQRQQRCLMVGSNQLLATFTKNDLKWLGSLAEYLEQK